jgi:hypothetical protein
MERLETMLFALAMARRDMQFGTAHVVNPDVKRVFKLSKSSNESSKCPLLSFFRQQGKPFQDRLLIVPHLSDGAFTNVVLSS